MEIAGKVAVITGGAVRVGQAITLSLAAHGAKVVVHFFQSALEAKATASKLKKAGAETITVRGDLTKASHVERLKQRTLDAFGGVDILVNNAAIFFTTPFDRVTERDWDRLMDTNLKSVFLCCKIFGDVMRRQQRGKIINIADVAGLRPWASAIPYCVSKAGVIALTHGLAKALAPSVQVNAVAPGAVMWPEEYSQADKRKRLQKIPLGRVGKPDDVARAVLFLIESDYITGAVVPVDGGRSLV